MRYRSDGTVEARTDAGEVAVETLHLNDEKTVRWRAVADTIVGVLRAQEARAMRVLAGIAKKLKSGAIVDVKASADEARTLVELQKVREALAIYSEPAGT